jgi:hypothetical protein
MMMLTVTALRPRQKPTVGLRQRDELFHLHWHSEDLTIDTQRQAVPWTLQQCGRAAAAIKSTAICTNVRYAARTTIA